MSILITPTEPGTERPDTSPDSLEPGSASGSSNESGLASESGSSNESGLANGSGSSTRRGRRASQTGTPTPPRGFWFGVRRGAGAVLLALLVLVSAAVTVVPLVIGAVPLTVLTGSMQPTIRPGDIVVSAPVEASQLSVGDVVTFQPISNDPTLITHRIRSMSAGDSGVRLVTRGDANGADDPEIGADQVRGRVLYTVPYVGWVTNLVGGNIRGPLITLVGLGLVGYAVFTIVRRPRGATERNTP
ncbi:signal peptidase I [Mycetocola sp. JXN-3]|uniref:signal peptidase I n=1 Tax=Mycetocola sp. JXN-3 TaxID=2116510 RepID=UPI00165D0065|nr:signal peptidase I [Mycetocola sp. JXN-3]